MNKGVFLGFYFTFFNSASCPSDSIASEDAGKKYKLGVATLEVRTGTQAL